MSGKLDKMSSDSVRREDFDNGLDGTCWESARSSWIYMEMEAKQRDSDFSILLGSVDFSGRYCVSLGAGSSAKASHDSGQVIEDSDIGLDLIDESLLEITGKYADFDVIYEDGKECEKKTATCDGSLTCDKEESKCTDKILPRQDMKGKTPTARRSVSLDSYPVDKKHTPVIRQSETVDFPYFLPEFRARPPVAECCERFTAPRMSHQQCVIGLRLSSPTGGPDCETDRQSVISVCTMNTVSTAGSCNSLYRIPSKLRKLSSSSSCSGTSAWSTVTSKNTTSTLDTAKFQHSISWLPKVLQDAFSYLWCENPDRDPFNTFSVSEAELTAAITHLEHQLSLSTRNMGVLSDLMQLTSPSLGECQNVQATNTAVSAGEDASLPFRVQFIMESYCNIYMTRWVVSCHLS